MKEFLESKHIAGNWLREDIMYLLNAKGEEQNQLHSFAQKVRNETIGNKVYFRGLIEFSNICAKDCYYCGIRKSNSIVSRYNIDDDHILEAVRYACKQNYASVVLQSGELASESFTSRIEHLLQKIKNETNGKLRVTLSLGEQDKQTFKRWFDRGAHRYLLRIETTNRQLYQQIHPNNDKHSYEKRLKSLVTLKEIGFQTGTGVMIGLPGQTLEDLANDVLFMKNFAIDMVGMGPFIEHADTPLYSSQNARTLPERFALALNMVAVLRLVMPKINIAAATALQAIDKMGREKAILAGANVIMPNITPGVYRNSYKLYDNKPCTDENADDCSNCLEARIKMTGSTVGYGEWGDSQYFTDKMVI